MSKSCKLSLVISNYNYGEFLFDAVSAAVAQTRPPDEIILIDDGSTDHSRDLIRRLAASHPSVRPVFNEQNLGCNRSINRAMGLATGEYVCSAGADDPLLDPRFFATALQLLEQNPGVDFCHGEHVLRYQTNGDQFLTPIQVGLADRPRCFLPEELRTLYAARHRLAIPTTPSLWRRTAFLNLGGLRHELSWFADWFAAMVFSARSGACYIPGLGQVVRFSPSSFSQSGQAADQSFRGLLVTLFETLETPEFQDVQSFFKIPGVISRYGFKLLHLLAHDSRFGKYLSPTLISCAVRAENIEFSLDLTPFGENPPVPVAQQLCREILVAYSGVLVRHAERERHNGRVSAALNFCRKAMDAAPSDAQIALLHQTVSEECQRWSRIAGRN